MQPMLIGKREKLKQHQVVGGNIKGERVEQMQGDSGVGRPSQVAHSESEEEDMDEEGTDSESHRAPRRNPQRHASKRPRSHADTTDSSD
ncbi:hypothetical protein DUNSADRAFT_888 [Dunaliella salina]|uniref:Encoded protein n=1 Tax=Dunaliella salina TaxID=3046 RepID=A0ABQ7H8M9_DUNSA|nr:hypothetical protein DUNSADRAFT_888 [Dunaliella salina]|eukprot:KAF5843212.1 hypothetical protein DUNSADRAFT_888 [Dunaliella salina]